MEIIEIIKEFDEMIQDSWTYNRFTDIEKMRWHELLYSVRVQNTINKRFKKETTWAILNEVYYAYLIGIGYDNFNWREEN